jgi:hypothetical protein
MRVLFLISKHHYAFIYLFSSSSHFHIVTHKILLRIGIKSRRKRKIMFANYPFQHSQSKKISYQQMKLSFLLSFKSISPMMIFQCGVAKQQQQPKYLSNKWMCMLFTFHFLIFIFLHIHSPQQFNICSITTQQPTFDAQIRHYLFA